MIGEAMKDKKVLLVLLIALGLCCSAIFGKAQVNTDEQSRAEYHLTFADSLETAGAFQGASLVYKMVAELYPHTMYYANAVRNLGHAYVNPFNSARNDSVALYWFTKHLEIAWLPRGERTRSVIIAALIRDRLQSGTFNGLRTSVVDSLRSLARIQSAELHAQAGKIAELTSELEQTDNDLQILLEYQKGQRIARKDSINGGGSSSQKLAEASVVQQARKRTDQPNDQLEKLREIDLRALQRRTKR